MDGAFEPPHRYRIRADRGSIAAGRDVHVHYPVQPCPACERRLIATDARICGHCERAVRVARVRRDGLAALLGFGICLLLGLELTTLAGDDQDWITAAMAAVLIFGTGWRAWLRVKSWCKGDALRPLRVLRRWRIRGIMRKPIRRVPGSERETTMERDEAEVARLIAEAARLTAEAGKANAQARWYPVIVVGILFATAIVLAKFVL